MNEVKRYNIQVDGNRDEGQVKLVETDSGSLVYYYEMRLKLDRLQTTVELLTRRVSAMTAAESTHQAQMLRLESELTGPDGFATWKDAAISERVKRVELAKEYSNEVAELKKTLVEARTVSSDWCTEWYQVDNQLITAKELLAEFYEATGYPTHNWTELNTRAKKILGIEETAVKGPIPVDVYYSLEHDNFYSRAAKGKGCDFYAEWISRSNEFPVDQWF